MDGLVKPKVLVVCGPTATGKTDLAFALCERFGGTMLGADSMQIYKGLQVGTAAPLPQEYPDIPRRLLGFLLPEEQYSVADYTVQAAECIRQESVQGRLPVVCGGTGLYISSLLNGTRFSSAKAPQKLHEQLLQEMQAQGGEHMLQKLADCDPEYAAKLHPADEKRILRGLEEWEATHLTYAERAALSRPAEKPFDSLCIALTYGDRAVLYSQIEKRVDNMMQQGLLAEAEMVYSNKEKYTTAAQAIGYKEFFALFEGEKTQEECVADLKQATRRYAKRQLTWFMRMPDLHWLQADDKDLYLKAEKLAEQFLQ